MSPPTPASTFVRSDYIVIGGGALAVVGAAATHYAGSGQVLTFLLAALAVTLLAALVGRSVEQLGDRFGPGATGVLQSALGNLPELFIALFALRAGLVSVVKAALIGSILANLLLVLGMAFLVGGLRHGTQRIDSQRARTIATLMMLSVGALVLPSLAHYIHAPAAAHEQTLSLIASVVLIIIFACSLPAALRRTAGSGPAMESLNISDDFAGLVIVAIAGNAIENVVGVQLAAKNQSEYAFSVIINSPLQIALVLAPVLVILSQVFGLATLTLVFSPLLVVAVAIAVPITVVITVDGESTWLEGAALIGVYAVIASRFWWG